LRVSFTIKTFSIFALLLLSFVVALAEGATDEAAKMLPDKLGDFRATSAARPTPFHPDTKQEDSGEVSAASRDYYSASKKLFLVGVAKARSDSAAFARLSDAVQRMLKTKASQTTKLDGIGTAAFIAPQRLAFFKGSTFVGIYGPEDQPDNREEMIAFARLLSETLDNGEGDIPALVKHLPDWEQAQLRAAYAVSLPALLDATEHQPVLNDINFEGGTEAVIAPYDQGQLVIIEYTTPQLAADADARIVESIKRLREGNQPAPSGYRRVGNYSVLVFNAPDEQAAKQLIDKVHYEQVVQWLGDNPRVIERMNREYRQTTAGLILAVIKAAGLSMLLCLGVGGVFGGIIFKRRRARQGLKEVYSDAGGMVRLNLDELTAQTDSTRLLGK
jgi:hypothetical protein